MIGLIKGTMRNVKSVPGLPAPIASFKTNVGGYPLKALKTTIEAVQSGSGDPYPAGGGKNKFEKTNLFPYTKEATTADYYFDFLYNSIARKIPKIELSEGVTYTFSLDVQCDQPAFSMSVGCGNGTYANDIKTESALTSGRVSITFTPTATQLASGNIFAFRVPRFGSSRTFVATVDNPQLELGSTATPYAPYSNIRPISGWTEANLSRVGKNLFVNTTPMSGNFLDNSGNENPTSGWNISDFIPIKGGQTYHFKPNSTLGSSAKGFFYTDSVRTSIVGSAFNSGEVTIIAPNEARYVRFSYRDTSSDIQLEIGSQATAYEAPNGTTVTLQFGSTLYWAMIDWVTGVATVLGQKEDMGNLNYTKYDVAEGTLFRTQISGAKLEYNFDNLLCSAYHFELKEQRANGTYSIPDNVGNLDFINNSYSDATTFKTAMAGQELVYELTTPFDIQLTPTVIEQLRGENNVFVDCGDIDSVKYSNRQIYYGR